MKAREEKFAVKTHHCQADGSIKIFSLMRFLQESALAHAQELGFGFEQMNTIDSYWVLSNIRIQISDLPKFNDEVTIRTWPSGNNRVIATREFVGTDESGNELFRAGSEWMVLNKNTNRLRNLTRLKLPLPAEAPKVIEGQLEKLEPREDYTLTESIRVHYSSIDMNGHVNNTEYVRWAIDALKSRYEFTTGVSSIQISYLSEVFEKEQLDLFVSTDDNSRYHLAGIRPSDQTTVFLMEINDWATRPVDTFDIMG